MKNLVIIFGLLTNEGKIDLIKIPITAQIDDIFCEKAIESHRTWQLNPHYKEGNGEVWGYYTYKNRQIVLSYCSEEGVDGE